MQTSVKQYQVGGLTLELEGRTGVFPPSAHGQYFAQAIVFRPHTTVLDIGAGAGILAVTAALHGAQVTATDVVPAALEVTHANALRNGVEIDVHHGPFFANLAGPFDQIVANLPQEIVVPEKERLSAEDAIAIDGGERGNHLLIALLEQAPRYMHEQSELWLPVHTLSDFQDTLRAALTNFNVRIHAIGDLPVKPFVVQNLDFYRELNEQGIIRIFNHQGTWYSQVWVVVLTKRSA